MSSVCVFIMEESHMIQIPEQLLKDLFSFLFHMSTQGISAPDQVKRQNLMSQLALVKERLKPKSLPSPPVPFGGPYMNMTHARKVSSTPEESVKAYSNEDEIYEDFHDEELSPTRPKVTRSISSSSISSVSNIFRTPNSLVFVPFPGKLISEDNLSSKNGSSNGSTDEFQMVDTQEDIEDIALSYSDAKIKASKVGPLGRKLDARFKPNRKCFAALIGNVLYLYNKEKDLKAHTIINISGYEVRDDLDEVKDPQKRSQTFEIVCPGKLTYQFVARSVKDKHQWIVPLETASLVGLETMKRKQKQIELHLTENLNSFVQNTDTLPPIPSTHPMKTHAPLLPEPESTLDDLYDDTDAFARPISNNCDDDIYNVIGEVRELPKPVITFPPSSDSPPPLPPLRCPNKRKNEDIYDDGSSEFNDRNYANKSWKDGQIQNNGSMEVPNNKITTVEVDEEFYADISNIESPKEAELFEEIYDDTGACDNVSTVEILGVNQSNSATVIETLAIPTPVSNLVFETTEMIYDDTSDSQINIFKADDINNDSVENLKELIIPEKSTKNMLLNNCNGSYCDDTEEMYDDTGLVSNGGEVNYDVPIPFSPDSIVANSFCLPKRPNTTKDEATEKEKIASRSKSHSAVTNNVQDKVHVGVIEKKSKSSDEKKKQSKPSNESETNNASNIQGKTTINKVSNVKDKIRLLQEQKIGNFFQRPVTMGAEKKISDTTSTLITRNDEQPPDKPAVPIKPKFDSALKPNASFLNELKNKVPNLRDVKTMIVTTKEKNSFSPPPLPPLRNKPNVVEVQPVEQQDMYEEVDHLHVPPIGDCRRLF